MEIIPVIDVMGGVVVRARMGAARTVSTNCNSAVRNERSGGRRARVAVDPRV